MNLRKVLFVTLSLLLICSLGWSQPSAKTAFAQFAAQAQAAPKGLPLVPHSATAPGQPRPFIWIGGPLTGWQKTVVTGLPSFCNTNRSYGQLICPNGLQTAYQTGSIAYANGGAGMTIGIVDAFHYKYNEADLNNFNADMGLPACTKASGCFTNLDQNGNDAANTTCASDNGWAGETMLDLEYAHAMAPNAKLLLVEGCTNSFADLAAAVQTAVNKGADVVSNSYGATDGSGESSLDPYYFQPVPILFSSGDNGNPTSYPCSSIYATCVGGTSLQIDTTTLQRVSEVGWPGGGGGCSVEEPLPSYQSVNGVSPCGAFRATPDISAISADTSRVALLLSFDGVSHSYYSSWGTSLATPVTAGIFADLNTARTTVLPAILRKAKLQGPAGSAPFIDSSLYLKYAGHNTGNPYTFYYYDVITGSNDINGTGCCTAGPGYDLVTGLGVLSGSHSGPPWNLP